MFAPVILYIHETFLKCHSCSALCRSVGQSVHYRVLISKKCTSNVRRYQQGYIIIIGWYSSANLWDKLASAPEYIDRADKLLPVSLLWWPTLTCALRGLSRLKVAKIKRDASFKVKSKHNTEFWNNNLKCQRRKVGCHVDQVAYRKRSFCLRASELSLGLSPKSMKWVTSALLTKLTSSCVFQVSMWFTRRLTRPFLGP